MNTIFSEAKRNAIIEAALAEFGESGFDRGSMRAVAERAGIAKGTLYLYFKDKDALFAEALSRGWELFFVDTEKLLSRDGSELDRLGALLEMGLDRLRTVYPLIRGMLFEASRRELMDAQVERLCRLIGSMLEDAALPKPLVPERNTAAQVDPESLDRAVLIRLIVSGILFEVSTAPQQRLDAEIAQVRTAVRGLMEGLLVRGRKP
jgi:TetR/AcrR family fatty acid metabolism transcriptional regulator